MIFKKQYFPLWIAFIALIFGVAAYLSWKTDLEISSSQSSASELIAVATKRASLQPQASRSASVQQMIDSGQFAPPPGNTERVASSVSPFTSGTRTASSGMSQSGKGNGQEQAGVPQAAAVMFSYRGDKIAAAVVRQDSQSVSNATLTTAAASPQTPSQPTEFESPPGVGSAKGGQ